MNTFKQKISQVLHEKGFEQAGANIADLVSKALQSAEEYVVMQLAERELSSDDQSLMKDAYLSAPDIFDVDEFLFDRIPDYDTKVDACFDEWIALFKKNLSRD